jgi:hypothetical protein
LEDEEFEQASHCDAKTDFGIASLIEFIRMYKDDTTLLKRYDPQ